MLGGLCDLDYIKRMVVVFIFLLFNNLVFVGVWWVYRNIKSFCYLNNMVWLKGGFFSLLVFC